MSGTLLNPESVPSFTVQIVDNDEISIQNALMGADVIIYSIAEGEYIAETQAALDFIQQEASHFTSQKMFILVSFCLTWNKTKPLDIDDPEIPFTEDDYRLVLGIIPLRVVQTQTILFLNVRKSRIRHTTTLNVVIFYWL